MGVNVRLTPPKHTDVAAIADTLCVGNFAKVKTEANVYASNGIAYAVYTKEHHIGYIPELATLRKWYAEADTEDKRMKLDLWGRSTKAVRQQFKIDEDNNGTEEWAARVSGLLFEHDYKYIEWNEYTQLKDASGWSLSQISIGFDDVELW